MLRLTLVLVLFAAPTAAQDPDVPVPASDASARALDPETGLELAIGELVIGPVDVEGGWLELTPLAFEAEASLANVGDRESEDVAERRPPGVPPGVAMLCTGAKQLGVLCEQVYVQSEAWVEPGESLDVAVRFEPGIAVGGRYLLDSWPIAGARVAVVPAGLGLERAFTMPLGFEASRARTPEVVREVTSDAEGHFLLPRLAQGEYFLETLLPSGRLHRSESFELPDPSQVRRETGAAEGQEVVWALGRIDVADGLVVRFEVRDPRGRPIAGARVTGRQGDAPGRLVSYQAVTDGEGAARLSGFSAEAAVQVSCRAPGFRTLRQDYPLLPVLVSCDLEPLATVRGEVLGIDGLPPDGARVSVEPVAVAPLTVDPAAAELPEPAEMPAVSVDAAGGFVLPELPAGEYRLRAAAPGFEVETRELVLEPGQRLELEAIVLLYGREIEGRVIDAETAEPIAGALIRAVSPPGAAFEVTGDDGAFTLATRTREPLVLQLTAENHAGHQVTVTPERLATREPLEFEMERGGWIRAVVWDEATDLPCQSCRLVVQPSSFELMTGAGGEATSESLAPGWYRVHRPRVSHLGSTVVAQDDAVVRQVRVRRGETSTVRFGERRRELRIAFRPSPGAGWSLSARTPARTERYHADAGGSFSVRHRAGESLDLFLHRYDPATGAEVEVRQATLPADFTATELTLPLAASSLHGRATSGGAPLAGERVRLRTLDHVTCAAARTRPDGSFTVPHLPAGVYSFVIGERSVQFASLHDGQSLDLGTFELIAGSY